MNSKCETKIKWLLLSFCVVGGLSFAYSYDTPASIKDLLYEHLKDRYTMKQFELKFSLLYSMMALPNVVLTIFLGVLIDKFSVRVNYWIIGLIVALGAFITQVGVREMSFWVMYIGRFLIGATGESIHIVEGLFLSQYFNHFQMSFVIAIIESFLSIGGFLSFVFSPRLGNNHIYHPFEVATYICAFNAFLIIIACLVDKYIEMKHLQSEPRHHLVNIDAYIAEESDESEDETKNLIEVEASSKPQRQAEEITPNEQEEEEDSKTYFQQIKSFPKVYWLVVIAGATTLSTIQCFLIIGPSYIIDKGYYSAELSHASVHASEVVSLFRIVAAATLPFFGFTIDSTGNRALWLLVGVTTATVTHILIIFIHPIPCCILYGICYAIVATSLWPSIYVLIPKKYLGVATGIVNAADNLGLMIYPAVNGLIKNHTGSYDYSQIFLASITLFACVCGYETYRIFKKEKIEEKVDGHHHHLHNK